MKKLLTIVFAAFAINASAQTFVDTDIPQYYGFQELTEQIDINNGYLESTTATVQDSDALSIGTSAVVLDGTGGANDTTNTITVQAVSALVGARVVLAVDSDSTNLVTIADSGNAKLASAWVGDNDDTITFLVVATNKLVEVSRSDN